MLKTFLESDIYIQDKTNDYKVRSLYFDTIYNKDLDEKLDGILLREKARLRVYNDHSVIKLEFKKRESSSIDKSTFVISKELANSIINDEYTIKSIKSKYGSKMIKPLIKLRAIGYRPRVIVEYDREAYILPFGNTRITIDKNLRSYNNEKDLFNIKYQSYPIFKDNFHILEVKFSNYLPKSVKYLLNSIDAIPHSISKYTLCQRYINSKPWTDNLTVPF